MKRDYRFDFYKGLLMIGVVLGHVITALKCGNEAYPWIHLFVRSYDMPMFAFISGIFLKKSTEKYSIYESLLNKVGGILIPILIWNFVYSLLMRANLYQFHGYWFLWSLFWCSCIVILVDGLFKNQRVWKNFCFALVIILCHMGFGEKWKVGFLLFPCVVGYYYAQRGEKEGFYTNAMLIGLFAVLQCFWALKYNVWNAGVNIFAYGTPLVTTGKIIYRSAIGILGCFVMKLFFNAFYDLLAISKYPQMQTMQKWIVSVGQNTLGLYILQRFFVETWGATLVRRIVSMLGWNPFVFNERFLGYCLAPVITIVSLIILLWIKQRICLIPYIGNIIFGVKLKKLK